MPGWAGHSIKNSCRLGNKDSPGYAIRTPESLSGLRDRHVLPFSAAHHHNSDRLLALLFFLLGFFRGLLFLQGFGRFLLGCLFAVHSFAHVFHLVENQKMIDFLGLPGPRNSIRRLSFSEIARSNFLSAVNSPRCYHTVQWLPEGSTALPRWMHLKIKLFTNSS